ncbi:MAG: TAXI family TRAP transporter solute-binding subunit [Hyphomicrobiales bacterium]|nr:TAXI family TRAP transporter solute-binding subunit [Hyphomicrobiales bacterium]
MNSTKYIALGASALVLGMAAPASAQEAVRIGTSSVGSNFYVNAVAISEVVQKQGKINTSVQALGGSSANVRGLARKKIEFAMANAFAAYSGYFGTYNFKGKKMPVRLVVQGHTNERAFLVRKAANIKSVKDLEGRTMVGKRRALPELALIAEQFQKVNGLKNLNVVATTNTGEVFKAFAAGSIDAAIVPTGPRAGNVQKAIRDGHVELLKWDAAKRDEMLKNLPDLMFAGTFGPEAFDGHTFDSPVIAMRTYFISAPHVKAEIVYKVSKTIFENTKLMATYQKQLAQWTVENSLKNFSLPYHEGTVRYFKEKKLWTKEHEAKQKKLLGS